MVLPRLRPVYKLAATPTLRREWSFKSAKPRQAWAMGETSSPEDREFVLANSGRVVQWASSGLWEMRLSRGKGVCPGYPLPSFATGRNNSRMGRVQWTAAGRVGERMRLAARI